MLIFLTIPVLAFLAGFLTHWRLTREQRRLLKEYRRSAFAETRYAPGQWQRR